MNKKINQFIYLATTTVALTISSCGDSSNTGDPDVTKVDDSLLDTTQNLNVSLKGKIFSIPSPFQTAELIKNSGVAYNSEMLNSPNSVTSYSSRFHKALNLGIYGADLGYVTMYDNTNDALSYLNSVQKLSDELDLGGAFSKEIIDRFSNNLGNRDSMLVIVSDAYRSGDEYLKNNDRHDVAGLILTGGWIEALYFSSNTLNHKKDNEIINRIGEQKTTLSNLIELLENFKNEESYSTLVDELIDLYHEFDGIEFTYEYAEPVTDANNQITTIKSKTKVNLTDDNLKTISEKVKAIREKIVNSTL